MMRVCFDGLCFASKRSESHVAEEEHQAAAATAITVYCDNTGGAVERREGGTRYGKLYLCRIENTSICSRYYHMQLPS